MRRYWTIQAENTKEFLTVRTWSDGKQPTKHRSPIIMQVLKLGNVDPGPKPGSITDPGVLNEMGVADWNPVSTDFVHGVTEALKLAFADREAYYGDPDFVKVPLKQLLSRDYNQERSKEISDQASLELRPGKISGF